MCRATWFFLPKVLPHMLHGKSFLARVADGEEWADFAMLLVSGWCAFTRRSGDGREVYGRLGEDVTDDDEVVGVERWKAALSMRSDSSAAETSELRSRRLKTGLLAATGACSRTSDEVGEALTSDGVGGGETLNAGLVGGVAAATVTTDGSSRAAGEAGLGVRASVVSEATRSNRDAGDGRASGRWSGLRAGDARSRAPRKDANSADRKSRVSMSAVRCGCLRPAGAWVVPRLY